MGRHANITIKESIEELKNLYKNESNQKLKLRLKCLIYTKEDKYKTQTILATHLGIDYSSLKRWFKLYREEGLASYLKIKSGEKIGIVGYSGDGKTTLIKSLIRYFDIYHGEIKIDDINIKNFTQDSLRSHISLIPQDITMFHRTILENLQIAKYGATKKEVIESCKKAKIHDDIMEMKEGYNSIVGERGIKVSGGQRQRIAIARAILKDAPILILDEATSSLDSKTEKVIQKSLDLLIKDKSKTVIAIAHRLSTLKNMDRIIVMSQGRVDQIGTHDDLIRGENSLYKKLWDLQEV